MFEDSPVANVIDIKRKAVNALIRDALFLRVATGDPNLDVYGDKAAAYVRDYVRDYDYIGNAVVKAGAYVTVKASVEMSNLAIKALILDVLFDVSKVCAACSIPGLAGNRLDNLAYAADRALLRSDVFDIGRLPTGRYRPVAAPEAFTSAGLQYEIRDFAKVRHGVEAAFG
jgi:hypothetical protein